MSNAERKAHRADKSPPGWGAWRSAFEAAGHAVVPVDDVNRGLSEVVRRAKTPQRSFHADSAWFELDRGQPSLVFVQRYGPHVEAVVVRLAWRAYQLQPQADAGFFEKLRAQLAEAGRPPLPEADRDLQSARVTVLPGDFATFSYADGAGAVSVLSVYRPAYPEVLAPRHVVFKYELYVSLDVAWIDRVMSAWHAAVAGPMGDTA